MAYEKTTPPKYDNHHLPYVGGQLTGIRRVLKPFLDVVVGVKCHGGIVVAPW